MDRPSRRRGKLLRRIRQTLAIVSIILVTLLFLDFTGTVHRWFGWMARIQFLPALLALNAGVVIALIVLTLLFGRLYCSVICPLGIMQDGFARLGHRSKKSKYGYSKAHTALRYTMLGVMAVGVLLGVVCGVNIIVELLAPYSAYGRIASTILGPLWGWGNNALAYMAERADSYAFYSTEVWLRGGLTLGIAALTLVILGFLAWKKGRLYCNTICPVGTLLGIFSKWSLFRPVIDTEKCNGCGLCARKCKAQCIDKDNHDIDMSRCVVCMDCLDNCSTGAIHYALRRKPRAVRAGSAKTEKKSDDARMSDAKATADEGRRSFLAIAAGMAAAAGVQAAEKTVDGGLAEIVDKKKPQRRVRVLPPGARSLRNLESHCTACQLCVSVCPNEVLRPSTDLGSMMQPESSYERGYCRPECTRCSEVCPTGAIIPITRAEKAFTQIGHAVWISENCLPVADHTSCGACARHCPAHAITMVPQEGDDRLPKIPAVDAERCIGCGACENLCPARPFSAIYVEGNTVQRLL